MNEYVEAIIWPINTYVSVPKGSNTHDGRWLARRRTNNWLDRIIYTMTWSTCVPYRRLLMEENTVLLLFTSGLSVKKKDKSRLTIAIEDDDDNI